MSWILLLYKYDTLDLIQMFEPQSQVDHTKRWKLNPIMMFWRWASLEVPGVMPLESNSHKIAVVKA